MWHTSTIFHLIPSLSKLTFMTSCLWNCFSVVVRIYKFMVLLPQEVSLFLLNAFLWKQYVLFGLCDIVINMMNEPLPAIYIIYLEVQVKWAENSHMIKGLYRRVYRKVNPISYYKLVTDGKLGPQTLPVQTSSWADHATFQLDFDE